MKTTQINWKKMLNIAVLGAVTITPFAGLTAQSEAQPGLRDALRRDFRTLEGVVVNDNNRGQRDFVIRLDNGQRVSVRLNEKEPRRLSTNDRVRVYGYYTGNRFDANSVTIINDRRGRNDNYQMRTLTGIVMDISGRRFNLNVGGRVFNVTSNSNLPRGFSRGDRVNVYGRVNNNVVTDARVTMLNNNNTYNNRDRVTFTGTVLVVASNDKSFTLRRDNGVTYTVRGDDDDIERLRRGNRVRVTGRLDRNTLHADDIDRL